MRPQIRLRLLAELSFITSTVAFTSMRGLILLHSLPVKYYEIIGLKPELPDAKRVTITAYSKDWDLPLFDIPFYRYSDERWIGGVPESEVANIEFKLPTSNGNQSLEATEIRLRSYRFMFLVRRALDRSTRVADIIFLLIKPRSTLARMLARRQFAYKHFYSDLPERFLAATKRSPSGSFERFRAGERICYFSHFDPKGEIQDYCKTYLSHLRECGFEILMITTSNLTAAAQVWLSEAKIVWLSRANFGRDFGSWQFGLRAYWPASSNKWVLIANDSVFGPIYDLRPSFARAESLGVPVVGATDSYELCHHLQSYFLYIRAELFEKDWMRRFWERVPYSVDKRAVINDGELGFSRSVAAAGLPFLALWGHHSDIDNKNPLHHSWLELIENNNFPFIKRELVKNNPKKFARLSFLDKILSPNSAVQFIDNPKPKQTL